MYETYVCQLADISPRHQHLWCTPSRCGHSSLLPKCVTFMLVCVRWTIDACVTRAMRESWHVCIHTRVVHTVSSISRKAAMDCIRGGRTRSHDFLISGIRLDSMLSLVLPSMRRNFWSICQLWVTFSSRRPACILVKRKIK